MNIEEYGIILNVEKFDECVVFYKTLFNLPEMFSKIEGEFKLTCLKLGGAYLMIETEGTAVPNGKSIDQSATALRFNISDLDKTLNQVQEYDPSAQIVEYDWGSVIRLFDPDGNRISIRDAEGFNRQARLD